MKLSTAHILFASATTLQIPNAVLSADDVCDPITGYPLPVNADDFNEPDWLEIIETAFPPYAVPTNGCPRLDKINGSLVDGYETFPTYEPNKWNPCYYTKAFAGMHPKHGGYPTPIDTKYHYEFAAPFSSQPGDGSTHHCPHDSPPTTKIQSCPKVAPKCSEGQKDCNALTDEFGIGHVPPFVPLAAVKNAYNDCAEDICAWYSDVVNPCSIPKSVLDRLIVQYFGNTDKGEVQFTPPKILDDVPVTSPKSTYYKLEYLGDGTEACADDNCRGPHYCSKEAVAPDQDIWGDFCPYIHTGDDAGKYRHPHLALAAVELWIANKCKSGVCPATWLDSPVGKHYVQDGDEEDGRLYSSITWAEMEDNSSPMSQPKVPYQWPNSGSGLYQKPLYDEKNKSQARGAYVTRFVALNTGESPAGEDSGDGSEDGSTSGAHRTGFVLASAAISVAAMAVAFV